MKKVIKLTENDIRTVVLKAIKEQQEGVGTTEKNFGIFPPKQEQPILNSENEPVEKVRVEYGTHESVIETKASVDRDLKRALFGMKKLIAITGVNPSNGLIASLEKVMSNFDNLYGNPKPDVKKA